MIGVVYIVFATVVAFWIGRPFSRLSFNNEMFNAAFRYALVRLRDASEAVAFYRGEVAERAGLRRRFAPVVANYKKYINRTMGFAGWNVSITQAQELIPYIVQFQRFYNGELPSARWARRPTHSARSCPVCRSSVTPTTTSPATAPRSSGCTDWSSPMMKAASCRR